MVTLIYMHSCNRQHRPKLVGLLHVGLSTACKFAWCETLLLQLSTLDLGRVKRFKVTRVEYTKPRNLLRYITADMLRV